MTKIKVPYGKTYQEADLPDAVKVEVVDPPCKAVDVKVESMIEEALEHPVGSRKLEEIARGRKKALHVLLWDGRFLPSFFYV